MYWLRDGKVWPAAREVEASGEPGAAVLDELLAGPTDDDPAESETAIPDGTEAGDLAVEGGVARLTPSSALSDEALAQVVYTLTDLPGVDSVEIDGQSYTRADFEDQTPAILVESPLPFAEVTSPLRVTGTANTFEATFQYELVDGDGEVVDKNFVTATSGTGTRGTFDFTTRDVRRRRRTARLRALGEGRLARQRGRDPARHRFVTCAAYSLHVADAPWRCSQCGTVNEPVANACRTCGRWPSLFDLESSKVETDVQAPDEDPYAAQTVDVEELEPEIFEADTPVELPPELDPEQDEPSYEPAKPVWQRFARLIVPIGIVLYILISSIANRGG